MFLFKSVRISLAGFMAVFLLIALSSFAEIDPKSITGMWLFEEGKGNVAIDSSEHGNDGEIHGAKWVDGKFGKALEFDGASNWVEVPHSDTVGFKAGVSFTITLYYKGGKVGGSLVGKNYEDTSQVLPWYLLWDDGAKNTVSLYLRDSASTSFPATAPQLSPTTSGTSSPDGRMLPAANPQYGWTARWKPRLISTKKMDTAPVRAYFTSHDIMIGILKVLLTMLPFSMLLWKKRI